MDEGQKGADDRRDFLKKMAVGGAVAWTAPVVLSSSASAGVVGSPPPSTTTTEVPEVCVGNGDWVCGDEPVICGDQGLDGICICEVDLEGNDICWGNIICADPRVVVCEDNSDCLPGWRCASSCCGTACLPPCDGSFQNPGGRVAQSGLTAAGV
jgi:hypothetical protein